jgi:AraC-like DNA-binding protein
LNERDSLRPKLVPPRGVLHRRATLPAPGYGRFWPPLAIAPFVEHFWTVSWDLAAPETHEVLPHPSVQFVIEAGNSRVAGVFRGRFSTRLEGRGRVLGTKFLPGGFRPFLGGSLARLTGRLVDPGEIFGADFAELERQALTEPDSPSALAAIAAFLTARRPDDDPTVAQVVAITERAATDRAITRVEHLATAVGRHPRSLQRLFAEYVGVSPKWVIQRYRLHEAAECIARGEVADWAGLALDLGYADQAHFIRDFRRLVGKPPADYARAFRGPDNR